MLLKTLLGDGYSSIQTPAMKSNSHFDLSLDAASASCLINEDVSAHVGWLPRKLLETLRVGAVRCASSVRLTTRVQKRRGLGINIRTVRKFATVEGVKRQCAEYSLISDVQLLAEDVQ